MTEPQSDPLEERVRRGLQTDGWKLPADEGMLERVHVGARRRRHRRQAGVALATIAVVAGGVGATGYVTDYFKQDQPTAIRQHDSGTLSATESTGSEHVQPNATATQETTKDDGPSGEPSMPPAGETGEPKIGTNSASLKPVPRDFRPASLTATSAEKFWVLGAAGDNASVALTDDGGKTFNQVGAFDARVANDQTTDSTTVHDVRFADDKNGWAYGNALWSTRDGGQTWDRSKSVPGEVQRLEAENGRAYALARTDAGWSVWSTSAGSTDWRELSVTLSDPSDLAATDNTVAITDRTSDEAYAMVSEDAGQTFEMRETPCVPDLSGGDLSASAGSLWLQCPTGTGSEIRVSDDAGRTWNPVDTGGDAVPSNGSEIGARSQSGAVVAMPGEVRTVNGGEADTVPVEGLDTPTYSGFTTPQVGYIIDIDGNLFRTTNAGSDWNQVSVR